MSTEASPFSGIFVPATTPFDRVSGDPAPVALRQNIQRWLDASVDGIVLFGSTGEGVLLDAEEKARLIELTRDPLPPDTLLVAGAGAESTRATARVIARLADAGAQAVLVPPPAYFGSALSSGALRDFYTAVADAAPVPVILYHMPKYTHVTMEAGLIGELARHENVAALKDSSGDLERLSAYVEAAGSDCRVFVGNGALLYSALELGAVGGVVAAGLLAPEAYAELYARFRAEESRAAGEIQERLAPVHRQIIGRFGVPGVKAALDHLGYHGGAPRPPLQPLSDRHRDHVARVLQDADLM